MSPENECRSPGCTRPRATRSCPGNPPKHCSPECRAKNRHVIDKEYHAARRDRVRAERDAHIDRWLRHGMTPEDTAFATGYGMGTVNARVRALAGTL